MRQEAYRSADGTEVRLTVLAPTEEPDSPRPTVLYGYGGFGIALEPAYTASALACPSSPTRSPNRIASKRARLEEHSLGRIR